MRRNKHFARSSITILASTSALLLCTSAAYATGPGTHVGTIAGSEDAIILAPQEHVTAQVAANDQDPAPDNDEPLTVAEILELHPELADIPMSTTPRERARACGISVDVNSISKYGYTLYYRNCSSVAIKVRPVYLLAPNGTCKTISPYGTQSWWITAAHLYNGFTSCR